MKKLIVCLSVLVFWNAQAQFFTNYTSDDGLIEGHIAAIGQDPFGVFWFAGWENTGASPVSLFDGAELWIQFIPGTGITSNGYRSILMDLEASPSSAWLGSFQEEGGVDRFSNSTWQNFTTDDGLAGNDIADISRDSDGNILFACSGLTSGLSIYDGTTFTSYTEADGLPAGGLSSVIQADDGTYWIGLFTNGVSNFDGTNFTNYTVDDGLVSNAVIEVFQDSNGILWFGTSDGTGLSSFDGSDWTTITTDDGLVDNVVHAIAGSSMDDFLYFGTNEGVSVYVNGIWTSLTEENGLVNNRVFSILEANDGTIWFGTADGVSNYNPIFGAFDQLKNSFSLYPNPTSTTLNIRSNIEIVQISLYDLSGSVLQVWKEPLGLKEVNLNSISQGIYWVEVNDKEGNRGFQKIVID